MPGSEAGQGPAPRRAQRPASTSPPRTAARQSAAEGAAVIKPRLPSNPPWLHQHEFEIIEYSVATDDPYAIKFTEPCIRSIA